jgi:hypothetical protein
MHKTSYLFFSWLLFCELIVGVLHLISIPTIENFSLLNFFDELTIFSSLKPSLAFDWIKAKLLLSILFILSPLLIFIQNRYVGFNEFVPTEMKSPGIKAVIRILLGAIIIFTVPFIDWTERFINRLLIPLPFGFGFLAALSTFFFCWFALCIIKNIYFLLKIGD